MGIFDKRNLDRLKRQAGEVVDKHGDKITKGLDKAARAADERTGGKHHDKIDKGVRQAKDALDKIDRKGPGEGKGGDSTH